MKKIEIVWCQLLFGVFEKQETRFQMSKERKKCLKYLGK